MKYHQETRQTPRMRLAQIWQEHENLNAAPLGRGSCTAVHRLPDIQFLPNSTYSVRYADTQLGTGGCSRGTANETGSRPTAATRIPVGTRPCQKSAGKGMLRLGFFKLKFSFQGLWKSLPGLHNPAAKSNLKWLEPRSEIGKYLTWGSGSLLHRPSQTSNHHRMRTGNGMSSFACIKLTFCWFKV